MSKTKRKLRDRGDKTQAHLRDDEIATPAKKKQRRDNSSRLKQQFPGENYFNRHVESDVEAEAEDNPIHHSDEAEAEERRGKKQRRSDDYREKKDRRMLAWTGLAPQLKSDLVEWSWRGGKKNETGQLKTFRMTLTTHGGCMHAKRCVSSF